MASMSLAHEEMNIIKDLDKALLADVKPISYWLFAEKDGWVGNNGESIIQEIVDHASPSRVVQRSDIPHSFPISKRSFLVI